MDFNELIASFAERHGIADLAAEDNAAALDIDGIVVTLVAAGDALSVSADIGEPPAEGRADFAELLLEASLQSDAFFAKAPERGNYVVVRRLALPALGPDAFDAALEALVNQAETWRRLLADFRPAAKAAAEAAAEEPVLGVGGFVQV
ncbi:MAG: type III secretion system chaperone [Kiritimatiellae bacterium]|nr:type III secretion system chaperone [Kiritimatiellia bacterium]